MVPKRLDGIGGYLYVYWPRYLVGFGGGLLLALSLWLGAGMLGYELGALVGWLLLVVLLYFLLLQLWFIYRLEEKLTVYELLFSLGRVKPDEYVAQIDVGRRRSSWVIGRQLTTGKLVVVDLYNPQMTPKGALRRWRELGKYPVPDPRLVWREGRLGLLPVPDGEVTAVFLIQTLSELWHRGDRIRLLEEIYHILPPGGRLLMVEPARSVTNYLVWGPWGWDLPSTRYWRQLLGQAGFEPIREEWVEGMLVCYRADKPVPVVGGQLRLNL
ncbi:MAG TPA: class I SAM-dependent methyltransferase [Anaerolineae bacterium]|nr:class I SAM-dependent methyltransferase [Anaerolineae bacterium]